MSDEEVFEPREGDSIVIRSRNHASLKGEVKELERQISNNDLVITFTIRIESRGLFGVSHTKYDISYRFQMTPKDGIKKQWHLETAQGDVRELNGVRIQLKKPKKQRPKDLLSLCGCGTTAQTLAVYEQEEDGCLYF